MIFICWAGRLASDEPNAHCIRGSASKPAANMLGRKFCPYAMGGVFGVYHSSSDTDRGKKQFSSKINSATKGYGLEITVMGIMGFITQNFWPIVLPWLNSWENESAWHLKIFLRVQCDLDWVAMVLQVNGELWFALQWDRAAHWSWKMIFITEHLT